ncbi:MAG: asparagine synthase (glutamine-hydrolyzing) [Deltaproteobacteria bacterium]|nr:asparagine synthase (glutamine-hydrolyzing) [Deltaproteobacteria bacterium]
MCGFAGALGDLSGLDRGAMLRALAHRGPDDQGALEEPLGDGRALWLGHRRLSIQDLSSAGRQPMEGPGARTAVVFNGELYTFKDLRAELAACGERFATGTDTEVLLRGYHRWGEGVLGRLRGMFAFALWDRPRQELLLARDRLGEKPLYYHQGPSRILFASEVRALLASGLVPRELDADGLDAYLTFGSVADPFTLVHGVRSVRAGECLRWRDGALAGRRYWRLGDVPVDPGASRERSLDAARERLRAAVARCMVADVPVAVLLSGGIDSSSNVVLLKEHGFTNLETFNVSFGESDGAASEAPIARLVAERFGTVHRELRVGTALARALVPRAVEAMDLPTHDGVNSYLVCHAIREAGLKVAVSGQGSDELFLGYAQRRWFGALYGLARALPTGLRRALARSEGLGGLVPEDSPREKLLQLAATDDPLAGAYLAQHSVFGHAAVSRLRGAPRPSPTRFIEPAGGQSALDRLSRLELTHYLRNTLLRDGDQMSMAHGLELRAPFVDSDLVECVAALPSRHKVARGRNKPLLLDAVGPSLPREVWDRPKQGFGLPYHRWLREGLQVSSPEGPELGLDPREVRRVRERFLQGRHPTRYWTLEVLSAWVRRERMGTAHL